MSLSISKSGIFEAFTESPRSEYSDALCSPRRTNKSSSRRRTFYVQTSLLLLALFLPAVTSQINGTCSCLPTSISFTFRLDEPEDCPGPNGGPGIGVSGNNALDSFACLDTPDPQVSSPVELTKIDIREVNDGTILNNKVITPEIPIPLGGQFSYDFSVGDLSEYPITSVDKLPFQLTVSLEALDADGNFLKQDWILEMNTDARSCEKQIFAERNGLPGYTGWLEFTSIEAPFAYLCPQFGRTFEPTSLPTVTPTTSAPTDEPTDVPSNSPTDIPTLTPITSIPTDAPTTSPSISQAPTEADATASPTDVPTVSPTDVPTVSPTDEPTDAPTDEPTDAATDEPIFSPTSVPTDGPIDSSVDVPTSKSPTRSPIISPTKSPVSPPTNPPSITVDDETLSPTNSPTNTPTSSPTCAKKDKKGNCKKDKKNPFGTKKDKKDKKGKGGKGDGGSKKDKKDKKANKKEPKEPKKDKKEPKEPKKEKKSKKRRNLR